MSLTFQRSSILATFAYRSIFHCSYTMSFYQKWLVFYKPNDLNSSDFTKIFEEFNKKQKKTLLSVNSSDQNSYYQSKLDRAKLISNVISFIPSVEMIALTGSVASYQPKESDDIDLLVICHPQTLWATRFIIILILELLHIRKRPQDLDIRDKICINLFLDRCSLTMPPAKQNLYTAHELLHTEPLFSRNNFYEKLLNHNK